MSNILLYSKFSPCCEKLFDLLNMVPEFLQYFRIVPICIDNKVIRDRISQERKIMVNYVPTLLLVIGDGTIEKYEGEYVFEWTREKINPKIGLEKKAHEKENIMKTQTEKLMKTSMKKSKPIKSTNILDIPDETIEEKTNDTGEIEESSGIDIDDIIEEIEDETSVKSPNGKINVQAAMAQAESHRLKLEEQIQGNRKRPNIVRR